MLLMRVLALRRWLIAALVFFNLSHFARAQLRWPRGTLADASSTAPPTGDGKVEFNAGLAIDGDAVSFWRDATNKVFPDNITLSFQTPLYLDGIHVLSSGYGYIAGYRVHGVSTNSPVATLAELSWLTTTNTTAKFNNTGPYTSIIVVVTSATETFATPGDWYSRINEIEPMYANKLDISPSANHPTSTLTSASQPSQPSGPTSPPTNDTKYQQPGLPPKKTHQISQKTAAIGIVSGAVVIIIMTVLAVYRVRRKSRKGKIWGHQKLKGLFVSAPLTPEVPNDTQIVEIGEPRLAELGEPESIRAELEESRAVRAELEGSQAVRAELACTTIPQAELPATSFLSRREGGVFLSGKRSWTGSSCSTVKSFPDMAKNSRSATKSSRDTTTSARCMTTSF